MSEVCKQENTIEQLFERIKETEKEQKAMQQYFQGMVDSVRKEISELKAGHAETKVYIKQIFDKLEDIKNMFSDMKGMFEHQAAQYAANQPDLILQAQQQAVNHVVLATDKSVNSWKPILQDTIKYLAAGGGIAAVMKLLNIM